MKRASLPPVLLATFCLGHAALAQRPEAPPGRAATLAAAREVMRAARYCALVTIGADGAPRARVVDAFAPEADMTVWIATNPLTRQVARIKHALG